MIFAPVFSWLWIKLGSMNKEPSAPYKFGTGLILLGLGFLVLNVGKTAAIAGLVPAIFLILLYMMHTLGELTLSPVGLSLVTKLAPSQIVGFLMGIWFLSSSIAHQAGKHIAKLTSVDESAIVQGESFKQCYDDDRLGDVMIKYAGSIKENGLEKTLVSDAFVTELNTDVSGAPYYIAQIQIKEILEQAEPLSGDEKAKMLAGAKVSFLTQDARFANTEMMLAKADYLQAFEQSSTAGVVNCLKNDSLVLSLGVFRILGFVAIGCGLLLFLLGPMVSRWMHGIK